MRRLSSVAVFRLYRTVICNRPAAASLLHEILAVSNQRCNVGSPVIDITNVANFRAHRAELSALELENLNRTKNPQSKCFDQVESLTVFEPRWRSAFIRRLLGSLSSIETQIRSLLTQLFAFASELSTSATTSTWSLGFRALCCALKAARPVANKSHMAATAENSSACLIFRIQLSRFVSKGHSRSSLVPFLPVADRTSPQGEGNEF